MGCNSEVYIRSDDMPRTLQSAEAFIKGMFPSLFNSSEDKGKLLTINTMDIDLDDMTPNWMLCPELAEWYSKMLTSKYYQQFNSTILEPLVNQIQEKLKWNVSRDGSFSYHHFLDCLNTHYCHNLSTPSDITTASYQALNTAKIMEFSIEASYPSQSNVSRLAAGPLLQEWFGNMKPAVSNSTYYKFLLYSGHGTSILPVLFALDIFNNEWVPYASTFVMELYKNKTNAYFVRTVYNGVTQRIPTHCNREEFCDFENFSKLMNDLAPGNECSYSNLKLNLPARAALHLSHMH